jgi:hypothetical protein
MVPLFFWKNKTCLYQSNKTILINTLKTYSYKKLVWIFGSIYNFI